MGQDDQSLGCRCVSLPDTAPSPNLSAPTLVAASLELKAEKQSAHSDYVRSVAFSPDGKTIVSGADNGTIKVWDAGAWALIPLNPHAQN
jgi:WD40 repeat protein